MPVSTQQRSRSARVPTLTPHPCPSGEAQQRMQLPEVRPRTWRRRGHTRLGSWLAGVGRGLGWAEGRALAGGPWLSGSGAHRTLSRGRL